MSNKLKKIAASVVAAATLAVGTTGISASAKKLYYTFNLGRGGSAWSSGNEKDDDDQNAYVYTTTGNVTSQAYQYFTLYKTQNTASANAISKSKKIDGVGKRFVINYTTKRGTGSISYIRATASYNASNVHGYWFS